MTSLLLDTHQYFISLLLLSDETKDTGYNVRWQFCKRMLVENVLCCSTVTSFAVSVQIILIYVDVGKQAYI